MSVTVTRLAPQKGQLCSGCPGSPRLTIQVRRATVTTIRLCRLCWYKLLGQARVALPQ